MPSCHMENWARPGCFCCQDHEEIGIIVALEIGVQLSIRGKSETFVVFTKINLFLEVLAEVNKFSHLRAHYVAVLFICVGPFQNFNILCIFYPSLIRSRLLHQVKWKFPVHLKLKWTSWNLWHFVVLYPWVLRRQKPLTYALCII